jgi:hypothetical protein
VRTNSTMTVIFSSIVKMRTAPPQTSVLPLPLMNAEITYVTRVRIVHPVPRIVRDGPRARNQDVFAAVMVPHSLRKEAVLFVPVITDSHSRSHHP